MIPEFKKNPQKPSQKTTSIGWSVISSSFILIPVLKIASWAIK
jgi:hypothetical protein